MNKPDVHEAIRQIRELPTLPSVVGSLLSIIDEPDTSALDLGRHIAADQSLSATLLRLVNSAYYGFYQQIKSVTKAIVVLGFVEVRNLALTATAFRALDGGRSLRDRALLWRHALAAAMAAERCACLCREDIEEAFVCGLLHDIGKVVLDTLYPEHAAAIAQRAVEEGLVASELEKKTFGMNHAEAGALLAKHWNLPPAVIAGIRYHHNPGDSTDYPLQANLAAVANFLANQAGFATDDECELLVPEQAMAAIGVSEKEASDICEGLVHNRKRIDEMLGIFGR